jgi:hypothetical protein
MLYKSVYILASWLSTICLAVVPPACPTNPHSGKTNQEFIPYINNPSPPYPFDDDPKVNAWFSKTDVTTGVEGTITRSYEFDVDTGSTGVMISDTALEDWVPFEYLSSSKLLYTGYWVNRNMYFNRKAPATNIVKAQIPILVVQRKCVCSNYVIGTSGATCPGPCTDQPYDNVRMMGVGFGRTIDGMPGGTPDKNPLLNVVSIRGAAVDYANFHPGYIINGNNIIVGLTSTNYDLAGFQSHQAPLPPPAVEPLGTVPVGHYPWDMMLGCVQVNSIPATCLSVSVLLDTGIEQSYIRAPSPPPFPWSSWPQINDSIRNVLVDTTHVDVAFGRPRVAEAIYDVADVLSDIRPIWTNAYRDARPSFVNTGSHIFRKYEVAYDPICGKLAFHEY